VNPVVTFIMRSSFLLLFTVVSNADNALKPVVRAHVLSQLETAQQQIDDKQYKLSTELLTDLSATNLSQYESSQVLQLLAFQSYQQKNPRQAVRYYQEILKLHELPVFTVKQTQFNLAQLYFSLEEYQLANKLLTEWFFGNSTAGVAAYELFGQINFYIKDYSVAISAIKSAIKLRDEQGKPVKQNWLQLLQVMYYESRNYEATRRVLEKLIQLYPKKQYWLQLAGLHGELNDAGQQLAVLDAAYIQGYLNRGSELKTLTYMYLDSKSPYKAAKVLEKGLKESVVPTTEKNLMLLANAWRQAKEIDHAITVLEQADKLTKDGNLQAEIAQLYLLKEAFQGVIRSGRKALAKGSLKNPGPVHIALGISLYKLNQSAAALEAFESVKPDWPEAKTAFQWKKFIRTVAGL